MPIKRLREEVYGLRKDVRDHFTIGGGFGPDEFVSQKEMLEHYSDVVSALSAYEKKRSVSNLGTLHDALMSMAGKRLSIRTDNAMEAVRQELHGTAWFKRLQSRLGKQDFSKLRIRRKDAKLLASLSKGSGQPGMFSPPVPEFAGTLRFSRGHIELSTSTREQAEIFAMLSLGGLVESKSHGWWHTHPLYAKQERPSGSDVEATKRWKIPLVTAYMGKDDKPHVHITDHTGKSYRVRID